MTTTTDGTMGLERIKESRLELATLIQRQRGLVGDIGVDELTQKWHRGLDVLEQKVRADTFKVLVLGQFNRGKSTFINALLGQRVLPTHATPTTAVINEVKYGEERFAVLHPLPVDGVPPPTRRIAVDDLASHVVVDRQDRHKENPYERVEVFWPLELCSSGVELIDSPGLNEDPERERITIGYLDRADAVVFVLDATQQFTDGEEAFLKMFVRPLGHEDAFFVFNKINQVDDDERAEVERYSRSRLEPFVKFDQRIFFVDAKGALTARAAGDTGRFAETNMLQVERSLQHFLTTQRGRLKVLVPARELQQSIREGRSQCRDQRALLAQDLDELVARYERNQPPLKGLERRAEWISSRLRDGIDQAVADVRQAAHHFVLDLADRLPGIVDGVDLQLKITINPRRIKTRTGEVVNEILEGIAGELQGEWARWRVETYGPMLADRLEAFQSQISEELREYADHLAAIQADLSAVTGATASSDSALTIAFDPEDGVTRPDLGVQHSVLSMIRAVLPQAAIAVTGLLVGFAPIFLVAFVPAAVMWAMSRAGTQGENLTTALKRRLGKEVAADLRTRAPELAGDIAAETGRQLGVLEAGVATSLRAQLAGLRAQVQAAMAAKRAGESEVRHRRERLDAVDREMDAVDRDLQTLIDRALSLPRGEAG